MCVFILTHQIVLQGYCFTAVYSPQNRVINYTLIVPKGGPNSGWFGVAQGSEMKGANMAVSLITFSPLLKAMLDAHFRKISFSQYYRLIG